jgi:small-conductance mechanosensitive channel
MIVLALAILGPLGAARAADLDTSAVPMGEIAVRAEEAQASLRRLQTVALPTPDVAAVEQQLAAMHDRIDRGLGYTGWLLESRPSLQGLERLVGPWARVRGQLADWNAMLTKRATQLQEELDRLGALRQRWTATRAEARKAGAPAPVVERIDELIGAIAESEKQLRARRGVIVLLQDRVAAESGRCDEVLARLEQLRHELIGGVLERGSEPVWSHAFRAGWWPAMREGLRDTLPMLARGARYVALRTPALTALYALGLAVLFALLWRTERDPAVRAALGGPADPAPTPGRALSRSLAGAWLVVAMGTWVIEPTAGSPVDIREITLVVPVSLLVAAEIRPRWQALLCAFGALFLVDRLRSALWRHPLGEQGLLLLETAAAVALAVWFLAVRRRVAAEAPSTPRRWPFLDVAVRALVAVWVGAFAAGFTGYLSLAILLTGGAVVSAYLALGFYAVVLVAERLAALVLQAWPMTRLQAVKRRPALVLRKARTLLNWLGVAAWISVALDTQGLLESSLEAARAVLGARFQWGAIGVSLGDLLAFGLTVWAAFLVSAVVRFLLEEDVFQHMGLKRGVPYALSRLLHYVILLLGFVVAVGALGVDLDKVAVLAGAFGVGIGFGLQNVVANFVAGLVLLMERPIHVGDAVQLGDVGGQVQEIGMRASIVRTWDGAEVLVPNSQLVSEKVVNWTLSDRMRRITLKVSVGYGSDPERVIELLRDVALQHPRALRQPAPIAVFREFGQTGMDFELWVWTDRFEDAGTLQSELGVAIHSALGAAKIELAVPHRVVHVRGGEGGPAAPGLGGGAAG